MNIPVDPSRFSAIAWIAIGLSLCAVELLAPGAFFVWLGVAAALVGAVLFFVPMYFKTQLLLYAALVAGLVLVGRRVYDVYGARRGASSERRAAALIGARVVLDEPIVRGRGRIRIRNASWRVAGADRPAGAWVQVVGVEEGPLLRVEPADAPGVRLSDRRAPESSNGSAP